MKFKQYIKENFLTQEKLAIYANETQEKTISQAVISYWCKNPWKMLNYSTRTHICNIIGEDVDSVEFE